MVMDVFKENILDEFEANLDRIFGFSVSRFREIVKDDGWLDEEIDMIWEEYGATTLRKQLAKRIAFLSSIFVERELDRRMTYEEFCKQALGLDLGLDQEDLEPLESAFPKTIFEANKGRVY